MRLFKGLLDFEDASSINLQPSIEAAKKILWIDRTHSRAIHLVPAISVYLCHRDILVADAAGGSASLCVRRNRDRTNAATDGKAVADQAKDEG